MVDKWVKILDGLTGVNMPRLEDRIQQLLKEGVEYKDDPENHKEAIELLALLKLAHADYVRCKDRFGDMFADYMEQREVPLNKCLGQFFTPAHLTYALTEILLPTDTELTGKPKRYSDPAAGTGRFMLSIAKRYAEQTGCLNFIVYNTELDYRAFMFCVMNAVLNGIPSITVRGDSLKMEFYEGYATTPIGMIASWHCIAKERIKQIFTGELGETAQFVQPTLLEVMA